MHLSVLQIRDIYSWSECFPSRIPGPGSKRFPHPQKKKFSIFIQKIVSKLSEIWSKMFIPDPDLDFLPIPDPGPGVKKAPDSGSATLAFIMIYCFLKSSVIFLGVVIFVFPLPVPIRGRKWKFLAWSFSHIYQIFYIYGRSVFRIRNNSNILMKNARFLFLILHEEFSSYMRSLQTTKENVQHFKTWNFFTSLFM